MYSMLSINSTNFSELEPGHGKLGGARLEETKEPLISHKTKQKKCVFNADFILSGDLGKQ